MQKCDAGDFIEFETLAEEIKSLRLVLPEDLFPYLCMNKMYMSSSRGRERVRERKKKRFPESVVVDGLYRVRHPHLFILYNGELMRD